MAVTQPQIRPPHAAVADHESSFISLPELNLCV
jgi:hypothetical protein